VAGWKEHAAKSVDAHLQQLVGQFNTSLAAGAPRLKIIPAPVPIMGCQLRSLVHSNQPIEVAELTRLLQDRICLTDGEGLTMCEQDSLVDFLRRTCVALWFALVWTSLLDSVGLPSTTECIPHPDKGEAAGPRVVVSLCSHPSCDSGPHIAGR